MVNPSRKISNVSYSLNARHKSLSVPLVEEAFEFGTEMSDSVWQKAAHADDFCTFIKHAQPGRRSSFAVFRTPLELVLGFFFEEDESFRSRPDVGASSPWAGDLAEIHFGSMGPEPWLLQLAIGISGLRFDSAGTDALWECQVFEKPEGWGAEIRFPLQMLRLTEGGLAFNICRDSWKRNEHSTWSPLYKRYHEVENFGELLLGSYGEIASLRMGKPVLSEISRDDFEKMRTAWEIPANRILHGPYLSFPEQNSICIAWETAGCVPAYVEYKPAGCQEEYRRAWCARKGGILQCQSLHSLQLTNLSPDTEYEYRLCTLLPVVETPLPDEICRRFRTAPAKKGDFSFLAFADLHSNAKFIRELMATNEAERAAFVISLGDNLSHAVGRDALFDGVITPFVEASAKHPVGTPLVFVRGNHEQLGAFACEYFNVMGHPSGKTWYSFSYGNAFFIVLDSGNDKADSPQELLFSNTDMQREEGLFLEKTVLSAPYREAAFRIVMVHMLPFANRPGVREMLQPLEKADITPDLMLCGHEHRLGRSNGQGAENQWMDELRALPYPVIVNACNTAIDCSVSDQALSIKILEQMPDTSFQIRDTFRQKQSAARS